MAVFAPALQGAGRGGFYFPNLLTGMGVTAGGSSAAGRCAGCAAGWDATLAVARLAVMWALASYLPAPPVFLISPSSPQFPELSVPAA